MSSGVRCICSDSISVLTSSFLSKFPDNPKPCRRSKRCRWHVLSQSLSKRIYDSRRSPYNIFSKPASHPKDIFRSVVISVFNDFLDGNLEVIRTLLCESCLQRIQCVDTVINATVHQEPLTTSTHLSDLAKTVSSLSL